MKPKYIIQYYIVVKDPGKSITWVVGDIFASAREHTAEYLLACNGNYLKISDYPELYNLIGNVWSPPKFLKRRGWFNRFRYGRFYKNPDHKEGYFCIPNMNKKEEYMFLERYREEFLKEFTRKPTGLIFEKAWEKEKENKKLKVLK